MSLSPPTLSSRLSALAQRLGLSGRGRLLGQRAQELHLPFQSLPAPRDSLWWQHSAPLERLVDMTHGALSGPVQEDKAEARAVLLGLVREEHRSLESFDLRQLDGLCGQPNDAWQTLEDIANSPAGKQLRIISYKDFVKTLSLALPRHLVGEALQLKSADWRGARQYWCGEQQQVALACAIVYARRRGLELMLPAELTHYRLNPVGLAELDNRYFMLAMPPQSWSDPHFMDLLLTGLPYARLSLLRDPGAPEFLLLPKRNPDSAALGEGLRLAGAPDVVAYLRQLQADH